MILVDTSVWVDDLRRGDSQWLQLLESASVLMHPFVVGEVACGNLADRATVLELLQTLPSTTVAEFDEVMSFVERHLLWGRGIGFVGVHLLAAVALTEGASLWTRDKRLHTAAQAMGCAVGGPGTL